MRKRSSGNGETPESLERTRGTLRPKDEVLIERSLLAVCDLCMGSSVYSIRRCAETSYHDRKCSRSCATDVLPIPDPLMPIYLDDA